MTRRIELLPLRYEQQRRERRRIGGVAVAGLVILLLLVAWWFKLAGDLKAAEDDLAVVQARNQRFQSDIDELQSFAELADRVQSKRDALETVMEGDVDWPSLLTEVALVVPGEVWLTDLTASAGTTEGATPVGTETAPVRVSDEKPFGRVQFLGQSLSLPGVAKWVLRQESVEDFSAVWLNSATKEAGTEATADSTTAAPELVTFDSTIELDAAIAARRFQEGRLAERRVADKKRKAP